MESKTKFQTGETKIRQIFTEAGLGKINVINPLGAGEYNAVYEVKTDLQIYVLKISPADETFIMTYEKDIMRSELFWYEQIKKHTNIKTPEIYIVDFTKKHIPASYFIMEKLPGITLDMVSGSDKTEAETQLATMAAYVHNIQGEKFGYIQNELYDNWYLAIRSMTENCIKDGEAINKPSKHGKRLLACIDRHKEILLQAECRMVNFDLWEPNVICLPESDISRYAWIDPERSFWGDPAADFVCLEVMKPMGEKTMSLAAHNKIAKTAVEATSEICIRHAVALGYLAIIMDVERHYRYTLVNPGYARNKMFASMLYKKAFSVLE